MTTQITKASLLRNIRAYKQGEMGRKEALFHDLLGLLDSATKQGKYFIEVPEHRFPSLDADPEYFRTRLAADGILYWQMTKFHYIGLPKSNDE